MTQYESNFPDLPHVKDCKCAGNWTDAKCRKLREKPTLDDFMES